MRYESATEKAAIIPKRVIRPLNDNLCKKQLEIISVKHNIVLFLSIELLVMTIYLILQIVNLILNDIQNNKMSPGILIESFITLISIGYLIVFIIVIRKYFPVAISIFICLTLIQLLGGFILLILAIMAIVVSLSLINNIDGGIIIDMIFIMIGITIIVLSILIILYLLTLTEI